MVKVHLIHSTNICGATTLSDPVPVTEGTRINKIVPALKELTDSSIKTYSTSEPSEKTLCIVYCLEHSKFPEKCESKIYQKAEFGNRRYSEV